MTILTRAIAIAALCLPISAPAMADSFRAVTEKAQFVQLINGRQLTRFGIKLSVSSGGAINGSAFGRNVTGAWQWQGGYFCRDLAYGDTVLGPNCQQVLVRGDTLRFIADQGTGQSADLRLR